MKVSLRMIAIGAAILCLSAFAIADSSVRPLPVRKIYTRVVPDSVVRGFGGHLYVSLVGKRETGDGEIRRIVDVETVAFAKGFNEPKAMAFTGERLLVVDGDEVWSVAEDGSRERIWNFEDFPIVPNILRRLTLSSDGESVYMTDMGKLQEAAQSMGGQAIEGGEKEMVFPEGRIFKGNLNNGEIEIAQDVDLEILSPADIVEQADGVLLIATFMPGNLIQSSLGRLSVVQEDMKGCDDIIEDSRGNLFVSSWTEGKVWRLDAQTGEKSVFYERLKSATGMYFDEENDFLYIADPRMSGVHRVPVGMQLDRLAKINANSED